MVFTMGDLPELIEDRRKASLSSERTPPPQQ